MKKIKKQEAAQAVDTAGQSLYEARQLRDAAEDCGNGFTYELAKVLIRVADQKLGEAFDAIMVADDYFSRQAKPNAKSEAKKKKLAVAKAA